MRGCERPSRSRCVFVWGFPVPSLLVSRCLDRRLRRPFDRSTYTSMSSGRSPAESAWPRIAPLGCRGRSWPRFALSSALGEALRRSSLAPVPRPASPAPSIAESRRLASSREYALLAMLALRRVCREPSRAASLSSLIAPTSLAELVSHEAVAPHVLPGVERSSRHNVKPIWSVIKLLSLSIWLKCRTSVVCAVWLLLLRELGRVFWLLREAYRARRMVDLNSSEARPSEPRKGGRAFRSVMSAEKTVERPDFDASPFCR